MNTLPMWVLANPFPAIHDFESLTVNEQTARIYGAMNQLISEYNKFADTVNEQNSKFTESEQEAREEFELQITKVMREFRCAMEQYLKMNLENTAADLINAAIEDGRILVLQYDPETEALNIGLTGGV